ncbi:GTP-binding protein [Kocuria sp. UBA5001]|uniref:GTP-binding protein n=1 Tax=Kocuria sp. UBA5001 TaxID=1946674 RepID=UPI0025C01608|nr:GTP-binding protein [Kocuria sp. UBA5001]
MSPSSSSPRVYPRPGAAPRPRSGTTGHPKTAHRGPPIRKGPVVAGQVAEPVSIAGGCLCCIDDPRQLDSALAALSRPATELDAIVIEGSGLAEPPGTDPARAGQRGPEHPLRGPRGGP